MKSKRLKNGIIAAAVSFMISAVSISPAFADNIDVNFTYTNGEYTFEKISHPETGVEQADGIVDYAGNGATAAYVSGESEEGNGDRGQSYSYASATYGDWVYINTMYGGVGVAKILQYGMAGVNADVAKAMLDVMYNGNLYTGEPDGAYAGGVLLKFNVKTGETKILMSQSENGLVPTFRSACKMNGKLYFVGMVADSSQFTPAEMAESMASQKAIPCIYEVDPENDDKLTCIYQCVDMEGYRQLVKDNVFTSTRAICTFDDALITGCLDTEGVFLCATKDPSAGQESFSVIADMDDLFNYPAYHRTDANGGGGIYQVIEYNGKLYVVICTGTPDNKNPETNTLQPFAIVRGECNGDVTDKDAWTWTVLAGDMENDGAKYPFGLDEERVSPVACTLEEYDGYLYIGDYNDVSSALQGFVLRKDFTTQATNLQQSINLYRMDKDENIEKVVGDPTVRFPESISGWGSGYETHMSQYTWQTMVYEGKLYVSTMDTTTLLEPLAQFTNGDLIGMSREEWQSQINYIRVLLQLLFASEDDSQDLVLAASADEAAEATQGSAYDKVEAAVKRVESLKEASALVADRSKRVSYGEETASLLTEEQVSELVQGIENGTIAQGSVNDELMDELNAINEKLDMLTELVDTTSIEEFSEIYDEVLAMLDKIVEKLPENVQNLYHMLMKYATEENLKALAKSIKYMESSVRGFDLYEITNNEDGSVSINTVTNNGFGDRYNHGLRIFAQTTDYLVIGTANPFYGTQLWRRANTVKQDEDKEDDKPGTDETDKPGEGEDNKPGTEEGTKPGEGEDNKPGTEEGTKPGEGEENNPGTEEETKPGIDEENKEEDKKPAAGNVNTNGSNGTGSQSGQADGSNGSSLPQTGYDRSMKINYAVCLALGISLVAAGAVTLRRRKCNA